MKFLVAWKTDMARGGGGSGSGRLMFFLILISQEAS